MKTRIAVAIASLLVASLGATAYAQGAQNAPQQTTPPMSSQSMHGQSMSNTKVINQVKRKLTAQGIPADNITVTFQDGTVTLSGTVASQREITHAKTAAMHVRGVKHVDTTNLQVQPEGSSGQGAG